MLAAHAGYLGIIDRVWKENCSGQANGGRGIAEKLIHRYNRRVFALKHFGVMILEVVCIVVKYKC